MGSFSIRTKLHGRKTLEFTDVEVSEPFLCNIRSELPHDCLNSNFLDECGSRLFIEQSDSEIGIPD